MKEITRVLIEIFVLTVLIGIFVFIYFPTDKAIAIGTIMAAVATVGAICFSLYSINEDSQEIKLLKKSETLQFAMDTVKILEILTINEENKKNYASIGYADQIQCELIKTYFPKYQIEHPYNDGMLFAKFAGADKKFLKFKVIFYSDILKSYYKSKPYFTNEFASLLTEFGALIKEVIENSENLLYERYHEPLPNEIKDKLDKTGCQRMDIYFSKQSDILLKKLVDKLKFHS